MPLPKTPALTAITGPDLRGAQQQALDARRARPVCTDGIVRGGRQGQGRTGAGAGVRHPLHLAGPGVGGSVILRLAHGLCRTRGGLACEVMERRVRGGPGPDVGTPA